MKKIGIPFLSIVILIGCKNYNASSVSNNAGTNSSTKQVSDKNANAIPAESIFTLSDTFQTQHGNSIVLSSLKGKPTVIGMIFTNCGAACPRLTGDMKGIAEKLKQNRDKVNFVLVSFDTKRDGPAQLQMFQSMMDLDSNWILLHGNEQAVRTLSVLLNVQFQKDAEGNFSHSNIITVLNKTGVLQFQKEGIEADHTETLNKINDLIN